MAIKAKVIVRSNSITKEKVASANIVDLQQMSFTEFCDYTKKFNAAFAQHGSFKRVGDASPTDTPSAPGTDKNPGGSDSGDIDG